MRGIRKCFHVFHRKVLTDRTVTVNSRTFDQIILPHIGKWQGHIISNYLFIKHYIFRDRLSHIYQIRKCLHITTDWIRKSFHICLALLPGYRFLKPIMPGQDDPLPVTWHNVTLSQEMSPHKCLLRDQEITPLIRNMSCGNMLALDLSWCSWQRFPWKTVHRKKLHVFSGLICKEIIHRKKLYIDHEKDPHPTGRISTPGRKYLHKTRCILLIYIEKNLP